MAEPYRTGGFACPTCNAALRSEDDRLVCDACESILIDTGELAASVHELDGGTATIHARDPHPSAAHCPRCTRPFEECALALGDRELGGGFLRCESDGIWMPRDALAAIYATAGRRGRAGSAAKGRPYGSVMSSSGQGYVRSAAHGRSAPPPGVGMVAVTQEATSPFARDDGLAISQWQRRTPAVHTLFVSAFRGRRLTCASCAGQHLAFEGDRWVCESCGGVFVEDPALVAMVSEMSGSPWRLPVASGAVSARKCPVCTAAMISETIEGVTIDRCGGHGHWFEDRQLQLVLEHAGTHPAVGGWLSRLFRH